MDRTIAANDPTPPPGERIRRAIEEVYPSAPPWLRIFAWAVYPPAITRAFTPPPGERTVLDWLVYGVGTSLLTSFYILFAAACALGLLQGAEMISPGSFLEGLRRGVGVAALASSVSLASLLWLLTRWHEAHGDALRKSAWEIWGLVLTTLLVVRL